MTNHVESVQNNNIDLGPRKGRTVLAALVASGALLMTGCSAPTEAAKPSVVATAPAEIPSATPSAEATPEAPQLSREELVKSLKIPTGLSDEELALTILDRVHKWTISGASDAAVEAFYSDGGIDQSRKNLAEIADSQSEIFTDALFDETWQNNPRLKEYAERLAGVNALRLEIWVANNKESNPFESSMTLASYAVERADKDGNRILVIKYNEENNSENLRYKEAIAAQSDGRPGTLRVNVHVNKEDGTEIITDIGGEDTIKQI